MLHTKTWKFVIGASIPALAMLGIGFTAEGCGGNASPSAQPASTIHVGQTSISFLGEQPRAVANASGSVSVVGVAGSNLTNVTIEPNPVLANTSLLYGFFNSNGGMYELWTITGGVAQEVIDSSDGMYAAAFTPDGRILISMYDPSTKFVQVFRCNLDGSALTKLSESSRNHFDVACAPNNSAFAFDDVSSIWTFNFTTAKETQFPPVSATQPAWSPDSTKILFNAGGGGVAYEPVTGGQAFFVNDNLQDAIQPTWSPSTAGSSKVAFVCSPTAPSSEIVVLDPSNPLSYDTLPMQGLYPQFSPDGKYIAFSGLNSGGHPTSIVASTSAGLNPVTLVSAPSGFDVTDYGWSPFLSTHEFVGSAPTMFSSASGFLWSQVSDSFSSFVAFQATTPTKATATLESAPGQGAIIYDLHADTITGLRYANGYYLPATILAPVTSDVLISFSGSTGQVTTVAPFVIRSGESAALTRGTRAIGRHFTGVWNAKGKNFAPNGASEISLDPKTGEATVLR